jgi:hypothetical protein
MSPRPPVGIAALFFAEALHHVKLPGLHAARIECATPVQVFTISRRIVVSLA